MQVATYTDGYYDTSRVVWDGSIQTITFQPTN